MNENTAYAESAEMGEVAGSPVDEFDESSADIPDVANQDSTEEVEPEGKTDADAAFAELRRRAEEAERAQAEAQAELERMQARADAREAAMENMDVDDIDAIAEQAGISREEVIAAIDREEAAAQAEIEARRKDERISELESQLDDVSAEKRMQEDLALLQKIDPNLKTLDDLGEDYAAYIGAGLSAEQAYYAIRGKELTTQATPAQAPGKIENSEPPQKTRFTESEIDAMSSEELKKNWEAVLNSWG